MLPTRLLLTQETAMTDTIKEAVRRRYARAAIEATAQTESCCTPDCCSPLETDERFGTKLYEAIDTEGVPDSAVMASLGCGNPTAIAALEPGQRVLDLGSGGGIDVFLAARAVGPTGRAIGLDMTDEMLELAHRNLAEIGLGNVEFIKGEMEDIPLPDHSVDVIISNCVINLSPDKPAVFREAHRVLVPGGRFAVSDVVATRQLTPEEQADLASWTGCIAGALTIEAFEQGLRDAGFSDITIEPTHDVAPDAVSALITATA
jgi:SAM-dependent methyltransferase